MPIGQLGMMAGIGTLLACPSPTSLGPLMVMRPSKGEGGEATIDLHAISPFAERQTERLFNGRRFVLVLFVFIAVGTVYLAAQTG